MPTLELGRIVLANVLDPQGRNAKCRPVVIVSLGDLDEDDPVLGIAGITGEFPKPIPESCVALPWHRDGHRQTGLKKASVAVSDWLDEIRASDIVAEKGRVPDALLRELLEKIARLEA